MERLLLWYVNGWMAREVPTQLARRRLLRANHHERREALAAYARVKVPWQVHAYTGALDDAPRSPPRFDERGLRWRVLPAAMTAHDAAAAGILHDVCPGAAHAGAAPPLALGQRAGQHDSATFFEPAGMLSAAPQPLPPHFLQPPSQQNLNAVSVRPALQRF